jgi:hypothetical protein
MRVLERLFESLSSRQHRRLERASTIGGVCLLALGLDLGGTTLAGLICGLAGVVLGLLPVVLDDKCE